MTNQNLNYLKSRLEENRLLCPTGGEFSGFLFELKYNDLNIEEINHIAKLVQSNLDRLNKTDKYIFFNEAIDIIEDFFRRKVNECFPREDDNESIDYQNRPQIEYQKHQRNMFILREKELRKQMNKIGETLDSASDDLTVVSSSSRTYATDQEKCYSLLKKLTDKYYLFEEPKMNEIFVRYMAFNEIPNDNGPIKLNVKTNWFYFIINSSLEDEIITWDKTSFCKELNFQNLKGERLSAQSIQKAGFPKKPQEVDEALDYIRSLKKEFRII
jgi:hypothetical protein